MGPLPRMVAIAATTLLLGCESALQGQLRETASSYFQCRHEKDYRCQFDLRTPDFGTIDFDNFATQLAATHQTWTFEKFEIRSVHLINDGVFAQKTAVVAYDDYRILTNSKDSGFETLDIGKRIRFEGEMELWKFGNQWKIADSGEFGLPYSSLFKSRIN